MSLTMVLTMGSVFLGFLLFGAAFAAFMYKKPQRLVWTLFVIAALFITVIPVTLAIFVGTSPA